MCSLRTKTRTRYICYDPPYPSLHFYYVTYHYYILDFDTKRYIKKTHPFFREKKEISKFKIFPDFFFSPRKQSREINQRRVHNLKCFVRCDEIPAKIYRTIFRRFRTANRLGNRDDFVPLTFVITELARKANILTDENKQRRKLTGWKDSREIAGWLQPQRQLQLYSEIWTFPL